MGTMLLAAGFAYDTHVYPLLNLTHPTAVLEIHRQYAAAGATLLTTNTFGTSYHLAHGRIEPSQVRCIAQAATQLAQEAASLTGRAALIGGSIGPLGKALAGIGAHQAGAWFAMQAVALQAAGADVLILETLTSNQEALLALQAIQSATSLPVWVLFNVNESGTLLDGTPILKAAQQALDLGAAGIGANCSSGLWAVLKAVQHLAHLNAGYARLIARPSAGTPQQDGRYPLTPSDFAECAPALLKAGANVIGGCCGSTPSHIRALCASLHAVLAQSGSTSAHHNPLQPNKSRDQHSPCHIAQRDAQP